MKRVFLILVIMNFAVAAQAQSAKFYNSRGRALWNGDRHEEALENYARAVIMEPSNLSYRIEYGTTLFALNRYNEAQTEYLQCMGRDSTYVPAYRSSGFCFYSTGEFRRAIQRYEKGLKFDDKIGGRIYTTINHGIGNCYAALLKTEGLDSTETNRMFECYEMFLKYASKETITDEVKTFLEQITPQRPKTFSTKWVDK